MPWLKRAQVATRLGRSIATVRRLEEEGTLLPRQGTGVRLFSSHDVDRLAERAAVTGSVLTETEFNSERCLSACADAHRVHGEPRGQRLDEPTPAYQCLLSNHRAMREELLALLAQLIELRPNTRMSDVLEDMLAVLGTLENGRPLD